MKDRNRLIYFITVIVIIIVYLVIYIFGATIKRNIYSENEGYQHNTPQQPVNNIISVIIPEIPTIFLYDYNETNYIELYNQFPTADEVGMAFSGDKYTHDFKLKFNQLALGVHYIITLKKQAESTMDDDWAKIYLTSDGYPVPLSFRLSGRIRTFNEYVNYKLDPTEKILYEDIITYSEARRGYKDFTLRMWVTEDLKIYNDEYPEKTFKAKITVYAVK